MSEEVKTSIGYYYGENIWGFDNAKHYMGSFHDIEFEPNTHYFILHNDWFIFSAVKY